MITPLETPVRNGVLAAGNLIVDHVKLIENWPEQDQLTSIFHELTGNGGGPYNVIKDLRRMGVAYPLQISGRIGHDADGDWILQDLKKDDVDVTALVRDRASATSYTDVMTVQSTGRRTFFHQRGANALFSHEDLLPALEKSSARWFYLGYLMLLDTMDSLNEEHETMASQVLKTAGEKGFKRIVDCVSSPRPEFHRVVASSARHADVLLLNEFEAHLALGAQEALPAMVDPQFPESLEWMAETILSWGVKQEVVIHSPRGAVVASCVKGTVRMGALQLPSGWIQGASGAGDAFAAGYLHGLHEDWTIEKRLSLAMGAAASCMTHPSTSEGLFSLEKCLSLRQELGIQPF